MKPAVVALTFTACLVGLNAQEPTDSPTFDVASIRHNTSGGDRYVIGEHPGRFVATNAPLRSLLVHAYGIDTTLQQYLLVGGPDDLLAERFDVIGTRPEGTPATLYRPMLVRLLEERFGVRTHLETRLLPVYALQRVEQQTLGPNLRPSAHDCATYRSDRAEGRDVAEPVDPNGRSWCRSYDFGSTDALGIRYAGAFSVAANLIQAFADRPIVDHTGVTGLFEWTLSFSPASTLTPGAAADSNVPSLYTAVTEQLGLKLQPGTEALEVRVIDTAAMPTPN